MIAMNIAITIATIIAIIPIAITIAITTTILNHQHPHAELRSFIGPQIVTAAIHRTGRTRP